MRGRSRANCRAWRWGALLALLLPPPAPAAESFLPNLLRVGPVTIRSDLGATVEISGIQIRNDPMAITIGRIRVDLLGGRITLEPLHLDASGGEAPVTVWINGLRLDVIAELLEIDGLTGEGLFDGQLPMTVDTAFDAKIAEGLLISRGGGVIRYRPPTPPAALQAQPGGVGLLMEALENFHYDRLMVTLNGRLSKAMTVGLQLRGRNPDLYGGHPFELNVNLEGALGTLTRQAFKAYALPGLLSDKVGDLFR